jgi:outer membrane receptor protein involved in Fe transport
MNKPKNTLLAGCLALLYSVAEAAAPTGEVRLSISAQQLPDALNSLARQTGLQLIFQVPDVAGASAPKVEGSYTPQAALGLLLSDTGLTYEFLDERTVAIRAPKAETSARKLNISQAAAPRADQAISDSAANEAGTRAAASQAPPVGDLSGLPEILVTGSKILNMDIQRTRDDPQPYVVFDRKNIETSGAANVNEFLSQRLTMNTSAARMEQTASPLGGLSSINLRGLGASQTLILVDGHRIASASNSTPLQANLNGIPLAAIERIEVLPTTASGIYGGGATGGVVNVILRRDYSGAEVTTSYENSFDASAGAVRVDFATGFTLENDRTNVLLMGSYADNDMMSLDDTRFHERARDRILANNPGFYFDNPMPPLGATPNIRSADGSPLFGPGTPNFTSVPLGYTGGGGLAPLQANAGHYNLDSPGVAQNPGGARTHLLKESTTKAFAATVRRQFSDRVDAFLELAGSESESSYPTAVGLNTYTLLASAPNNPFGQAVRVTVPLVGAETLSSASNDDRRAMGGVIVKLPGRWLAEADYTWSQATLRVEEPSMVFGAIPAVMSGALDVLRDPSAYPFDFSPYRSPRSVNGPHRSTLKDATLRFAGPVMQLPAGPLSAATLLEYREEILPRSSFTGGYFPGKSQDVMSAYVELKAPLIAGETVGAESKLELQIAGRYDDYSVTGATGYVFDGSGAVVERVTSDASSFNPTLGLRFQPFEDVMFRASWGTGFLPPSVSQIFPNPPSLELMSEGIDPLRGNTPAGPYETVYGGNPALTPEESESFSVGAVLRPRFIEGLRLSVDYSRIRKTDNIVELTAQQILDNEALLSNRVTRGEPLPGDPAGWAGPVTLLDASLINISRARVEAYDFALDYNFDAAGFGTIDFYLLGTLQTHYVTQVVPSLPEEENVGVTSNSPLKLKANAGVTWQRGPWTAGWISRYYDAYDVAANPLSAGAVIVANQGGLRVSDQIYHDLFASHRFIAEPGSLLDGLQVQLSVKNIFDSTPPFDAGSANASPYYYSAFGDPRGATYYISLKKTFGR